MTSPVPTLRSRTAYGPDHGLSLSRASRRHQTTERAVGAWRPPVDLAVERLASPRLTVAGSLANDEPLRAPQKPVSGRRTQEPESESRGCSSPSSRPEGPPRPRGRRGRPRREDPPPCSPTRLRRFQTKRYSATFFDELRLQAELAEARDPAVDVVVAVDEADAADFRADLHHRRRPLP